MMSDDANSLRECREVFLRKTWNEAEELATRWVVDQLPRLRKAASQGADYKIYTGWPLTSARKIAKLMNTAGMEEIKHYLGFRVYYRYGDTCRFNLFVCWDRKDTTCS
jgi:hypothetical protein